MDEKLMTRCNFFITYSVIIHILYIYYNVCYASAKTSGLKDKIIYDHPTKKFKLENGTPLFCLVQ